MASNTWPSDLVETTEETFKEFSNPPDDMCRGVDSYGQLQWGKKVLSSYENAKQELFWRNSELPRADVELYKVQDSDMKAQGTVSEWRKYRVLLRAWPEDANFPNKEFRPKSPDFKE